MATWLRLSTAVDIGFGPFVDNVDGFTPRTALTITQPDIRLKKNAAAWAQKNAAQTLTHEENGWYEISLDATDTDTLGILLVAVNESGALPVWREFLVVPAQVWDSYLSTDALQVHAVEITAGLITAAAIADGAIDAATFAAGAINAAAIAADAIGASELAADAVTEIQAGLSTLTAAQVNAEVVDALNVDTYAEPGQATPAATASLVSKIGYLFKAWRNRHTQTATLYRLYNDDAATVDQQGTVADDGTTASRTEIVTGP